MNHCSLDIRSVNVKRGEGGRDSCIIYGRDTLEYDMSNLHDRNKLDDISRNHGGIQLSTKSWLGNLAFGFVFEAKAVENHVRAKTLRQFAPKTWRLGPFGTAEQMSEDLSNFGWTDRDLEFIEDIILQGASNFKGGRAVVASFFKTIAGAMYNRPANLCPKLSILRFFFHTFNRVKGIHFEDLCVLFDAIRDTVRTLDLTSSSMEGKIASAGVLDMPELRQLKLKGTGVTAEDILQIVDSKRCPEHLNYVSFDIGGIDTPRTVQVLETYKTLLTHDRFVLSPATAGGAIMALCNRQMALLDPSLRMGVMLEYEDLTYFDEMTASICVDERTMPDIDIDAFLSGKVNLEGKSVSGGGERGHTWATICHEKWTVTECNRKSAPYIVTVKYRMDTVERRVDGKYTKSTAGIPSYLNAWLRSSKCAFVKTLKGFFYPAEKMLTLKCDFEIDIIHASSALTGADSFHLGLFGKKRLLTTRRDQRMSFNCRTGTITKSDLKRDSKPAIALLYMTESG